MTVTLSKNMHAQTLILNPVTTLHVVALNSNQRRDIPRSVLASSNLLELRKAVGAGESRWNLPLGVCDWQTELQDGNVVSNLWRAPTLVATACVATSPVGAMELWDLLTGLHAERMGLELIPGYQPPAPPAETPWLGLTMPTEFLVQADPQMIMMVQALHWMLAWAVIEEVAALQQRN
jgi:hypothetical protein